MTLSILRVVAIFLATGLISTFAASRPNIIVILGDDMGFSDIGCYGGEIQTPNLDALAKDGLRFTQFYNTARCCPTRASLLTGLYPHQAGVGHMMEDRGVDGYRGRLNQQCVTIAEALKPAGYRTYALGKWHLTPGPGPKAQPDKRNWPLQRGFDHYYGTIPGAGSFFDPSGLVRDNNLITVANDPEYRPKEFYYTDALADHGVKFIREHAREHKGEPFFIYTAFTAAHWPLHAKESDVAKYKGKYDGGYEPIREARWEKAKKLGIIEGKWGRAPAADKWADVKDKAFEARCMEVYAAQVDSMDQGIGRMIAELKAQGLFQNTLIFFLQDNGGCAEPIGRGGVGAQRGERPSLPVMAADDQQYGSQPKQTRDGWPVRQGYGVMPGGADTFMAYGRGWANVSNTPFREYKHWTHEGGISTPLIAHWPAGITSSRRNKLEKEPAHLIDIMATCLDLAGAEYPREHAGQKIKPMQGVTLRPAFSGKSIERAQPIFWEHEANRAVRSGKWKLVAKENQPWELYDMEKDRAELHDAASEHPEKVKEFAGAWDDYSARADVLPLGAWRRAETTPGNFSKEQRFMLKGGDHLDRNEAPNIAGKAFTIRAKFDTKETRDGVIVAQGGSNLGYALFLKDGKVAFTVRSGGKVALVESRDEMRGSHEALAGVDEAGGVSLMVDKQTITTAKGTLIRSMPVDGLEVGSDGRGAVGPYSSPNAFGGTIESVVIEIGAPGAN